MRFKKPDSTALAACYSLIELTMATERPIATVSDIFRAVKSADSFNTRYPHECVYACGIERGVEKLLQCYVC